MSPSPFAIHRQAGCNKIFDSTGGAQPTLVLRSVEIESQPDSECEGNDLGTVQSLACDDGSYIDELGRTARICTDFAHCSQSRAVRGLRYYMSLECECDAMASSSLLCGCLQIGLWLVASHCVVQLFVKAVAMFGHMSVWASCRVSFANVFRSELGVGQLFFWDP